jgi:CRP/FNR family transcriptional regulator, anaerobic regulatory protein
MEEILAFLNQIFRLSPACIEYLASVVQYRRVEKNDTILDFGEVNRNLYFIKTGLLRCFYMVHDKEVSDWFFSDNETIVSIGSFYQQVPSEDRIVAEEAGELYFITKDQYELAKRTFHEFAYIASVLLEKYLMTFHDHARMLRKYDATERYKMVLAKFPQWVLRVPLAALASWLNMEPETLSRVRGRIF